MTFEEIKQSLSLLDDPVNKLEYVMDLGKQLPEIPENATCTEIMGCVSFVKICQYDNHFYGFADSAMVRGIVAIFLAMIEGKDVEEIKQMDLLGVFNSLKLNFGASRLNGIQSMVNFFKNL